MSAADFAQYQGIGTVKIKRTEKRSRRSKVASGVSKPKTMIASAASALMSRAKGRHGKSSDSGAATPTVDPTVADVSVSETDSADDSDDLDDEEDLQDDGLTSDSSEFEGDDDDVQDGDDDPLLFESAEEAEYLAEDANDRVAPLAKDHSRQRRASRRTSNGSYDSSTSVGNVRKPVRQESMNSTSSNDAGMAFVSAPASGSKTPSSILQDAGNTSASNSTAELVRPTSGQETSVRIVSPSTASSSPHPSGYFDTVPAPASVARRRLFKKSSKDDYGPGTPGSLLTPGAGMDSGAATPSSLGGAPPTTRKRRPVFKRGRGKKGTTYTLNQQGHDILGIVMLEIEGAVDLPKLRNCRYNGALYPDATNA